MIQRSCLLPGGCIASLPSAAVHHFGGRVPPKEIYSSTVARPKPYFMIRPPTNEATVHDAIQLVPPRKTRVLLPKYEDFLPEARGLHLSSIGRRIFQR